MAGTSFFLTVFYQEKEGQGRENTNELVGKEGRQAPNT